MYIMDIYKELNEKEIQNIKNNKNIKNNGNIENEFLFKGIKMSNDKKPFCKILNDK